MLDFMSYSTLGNTNLYYFLEHYLEPYCYRGLFFYL